MDVAHQWATCLLRSGNTGRDSVDCLPRRHSSETDSKVFRRGHRFFIVFISYLIGVDPNLANASHSFVGIFAFWIYVATQVMAVVSAAYDKFGLEDIANEAKLELKKYQAQLSDLRAGQNG